MKLKKSKRIVGTSKKKSKNKKKKKYFAGYYIDYEGQIHELYEDRPLSN